MPETRPTQIFASPADTACLRSMKSDVDAHAVSHPHSLPLVGVNGDFWLAKLHRNKLRCLATALPCCEQGMVGGDRSRTPVFGATENDRSIGARVDDGAASRRFRRPHAPRSRRYLNVILIDLLNDCQRIRVTFKEFGEREIELPTAAKARQRSRVNPSPGIGSLSRS